MSPKIGSKILISKLGALKSDNTTTHMHVKLVYTYTCVDLDLLSLSYTHTQTHTDICGAEGSFVPGGSKQAWLFGKSCPTCQ